MNESSESKSNEMDKTNSSKNPKWMIYGANGYTGALIAHEAKIRQMTCLKGTHPILAGRDPEKIIPLAKKLGFEYRVFSLNQFGQQNQQDQQNQQNEIEKNLEGVQAVLNCAGPFSSTHKPLFEACLKQKVHYLDITGEIPVFERIQRKKAEVVKAGIIAIPGVGFDIVPSDCLAAILKREMPEANHLTLAIKIENGVSPGTYKTLVEGVAAGQVIRENGELKMLKWTNSSRHISFHPNTTNTANIANVKPEMAIGIAWADVATAFYSTGIPNIETYFVMSPLMISLFKFTRIPRLLFAFKPIQTFFQTLIERNIKGDESEQLEKGKALIWGEVVSKSGKKLSKLLTTGHSYSFTADSALLSVESVLAGKVRPGVWTPSQAFGADFIFQLKNVKIEESN